jgi:hypothetical protein
VSGGAPDPYGRSWALVDGDLVLEAAVGELVGVREVSGAANLMQALELRVLTPFGSDRFNVTYGLDAEQIFTSGDGLRATKDLIRLNLVRTLGSDRRVRDVREILFMDEPDYLDRHGLSAEDARAARQRRAWAVDVALELVPAGDLVLALEVSG